MLRRTAAPSDEAIHEARKSVKKVRAIVELIDAAGGQGADGIAVRLRRVNHTLSRLRDADAMSEILGKLRERTPSLISEHTFARVRRRLTVHKKAAIAAAKRDGTWHDVDRQLRKARRAARRISLGTRGIRTLALGIRRSHRLGRKAMTRARKRQTAEDFHEWRKQIKALWYQLRLMEICGKRVSRDVGALHRAETWLGDDHNIVVLCAELAKDASICGGMVDLDRLRVAADRYQCRMRTQAINAAAGIYGRKPKQYVRALKRAWKSARRGATDSGTKSDRRAA